MPPFYELFAFPSARFVSAISSIIVISLNFGNEKIKIPLLWSLENLGWLWVTIPEYFQHIICIIGDDEAFPGIFHLLARPFFPKEDTSIRYFCVRASLPLTRTPRCASIALLS